jgi:YVTN family beta-propeller protein
MSQSIQIVLVFQLYFVSAMVANAGMIQVYVANFDGGTVSVIDAETNSVTATVPVGERPSGVVAHPDGSRVYVANRNSDNLSVIDTTTNEVIATVPVAGGPFGLDMNSDGSRLYVGNRNTQSVQVVDTMTNTVISSIGSGPGTNFVAVNPDGGSVYSSAENGINVFDAGLNAQIATVQTRATPDLEGSTWTMDVLPDGSRLYANNAPIFPGRVGVIDTATNMMTSTITVGNGATGIAINPDGKSVYISNRTDNTISVIDTETDLVTGTIPVNAEANPRGLAVHPNGLWLYVNNFDTDSVSVIDLPTSQVLATIPVGNGPGMGIAVSVVPESPEPLLGDVNLDGVVNGLDVDPFVEGLLSGPYQPEADMNEDQVVNGLDVDPFVAAVVGGTQPVPEPSTLLLCLVALGLVGGWRKWGG